MNSKSIMAKIQNGTENYRNTTEVINAMPEVMLSVYHKLIFSFESANKILHRKIE